jgi:predicted  nucleic acid-binding Zn-ribbon protein
MSKPKMAAVREKSGREKLKDRLERIERSIDDLEQGFSQEMEELDNIISELTTEIGNLRNCQTALEEIREAIAENPT